MREREGQKSDGMRLQDYPNNMSTVAAERRHPSDDDVTVVASMIFE